jgi:hypothetical protein
MNTLFSVTTKLTYTKQPIRIPNTAPSQALLKIVDTQPEGWYRVSDSADFSNNPSSPYTFSLVDVNYCTSPFYKNNIYTGLGITDTYKGL